jgi:hypothetical protein
MKSIALFFALFAALPAIASADQYVRGSQVVHTRLAPVVAHRVLPPYRGVHVYEGRSVRR